MKHVSILAIAALTIAALVATDFADARRLGGGRSFGSQRQSIAPTTPSTTPSSPSAPSAAPSTPSGAASNPVMPANPSTTAPRATTPPAAPAPSGASRWLGPIAGLAAGIGLAALLSHFGLSEAFASFLLLALIIVAAVFLLRWLFVRRTPARSPMQYAGAAPIEPSAPRGFENHVGPTWGTATAPMPAAATSAPRIPAGFDVERFAREAKQQFNRLQAAWDAGDRQALADVMTPRMFAEVERDLGAQSAHQPSEVVTLDAEVLEAAQEGDKYVASVRFHGLMREDGATTPQPFDEAWNLEKPADGKSGWLLAGIQQLERAS